MTLEISDAFSVTANLLYLCSVREGLKELAEYTGFIITVTDPTKQHTHRSLLKNSNRLVNGLFSYEIKKYASVSCIRYFIEKISEE